MATFPLLSPLGLQDADEPIEFDFSKPLGTATISTVTSVTSAPSGLTFGTASVQTSSDSGKANASVNVPVTPGTQSQTYTVTAIIVTSDGRTLGRSLLLPVQKR